MEKRRKKIAAVIVTFNRLDLLKKCFAAIERQTLLPETVYIVNNASTDGTKEYLENLKSNICVVPINLTENSGGAGGFYTGIKTAHESNRYDAYWVMDDDGVPDSHCLENLVQHLDNHDFVSPLVVSIDNKGYLSFPYLKEKTISEAIEKYGESGVIHNYSNPFNGVIFSKNMVEIIGYPKKEMFIWGDEAEYQLRAKSFGFFPVTILNAIHNHPSDRLVPYKNFLGQKCLIYVDSALKRYCKYRNEAYARNKYQKFRHPLNVYFILSYTIFYLFNRKFDLKGLKLFFKAYRHGMKGDFSHTKEYM